MNTFSPSARDASRTIARRLLGIAVLAGILGIPVALAACDDSESHSKTTTTKTVDSPTEKTTTTTTTEKKTETQQK